MKHVTPISTTVFTQPRVGKLQNDSIHPDADAITPLPSLHPEIF